MTAQSLSVPVFIFVVVAVFKLLYRQVQDWVSLVALGISLGICAIFLLKGIDVLIYRKKDNPDPIDVPKTLEEAFGTIQERIRESNVGPFWWSIRTANQDESRILANLSFTEIYPTLTGGSQQLHRLMVLAVHLSDLALKKQKPESEALANLGVNTPTLLSRMQLTWSVDSPANRMKCNEIIEDMTYDLKQSLGVTVLPRPKERHPLEPPAWTLILVAITGMMTLESYFESEAFRIQTEKDAEFERQIETSQEFLKRMQK